MQVDKPMIQASAAHPSLSPFLIGFVERAPLPLTGGTIELPFAIPVIHLALGSGAGPNLAFSSGSALARPGTIAGDRSIFVIALGFSGAGSLVADVGPPAAGRLVDIEGPFWPSLHEQLSSESSFAARVEIAERALSERLAAASRPVRQSLKAADAIIQDRWIGSVAGLANAFGSEERTLRNRFRRELGWTPKKLLRVARFNRSLRTLHPHSWAGAPRGDIRLEFADDAHFHHEFTRHAGFSPRAFVEAKRLSGDAALHHVTLESLGQALARDLPRADPSLRRV